jgi:hypothetical protein
VEYLDYLILIGSCFAGEILATIYVHQTAKNIKISKNKAFLLFISRVIVAILLSSIIYTALSIRNIELSLYVGSSAWGSTAYLVSLIEHKRELTSAKTGSFILGVENGLKSLETTMRDRSSEDYVDQDQAEKNFYRRAADEIKSHREASTQMLSGINDEQ